MPNDKEDIQFELARPGDLEDVTAIWAEANNWTTRDGAIMWEPREVGPAKAQSLIDAGSLFMVRIGGETVGTVAYESSDPIFWPEINDGSTAFVHRLAVRRCFAGREIGKEMISWARARAIGEGKRYLRLDCDATRKRLCDFYERLGFTKTEEKWIGAIFSALFEMKITGEDAM